MNTSVATSRRLPNLVELDSQGIILFFKWSFEVGSSSPAQNDLIGRNFFSEVATFENVIELRELFNRFDENRYPSNSFVFYCKYEDGFERVKVLLARLHEKKTVRQPDSFLMYINKAS